jgi:NADH-quinone oxidoreductase subunit L
MFRLWFMTFAGKPRDHHVAEHAHESPQVMVMPLLVLAVLAVVAGWTLPGGLGIANLIEQSRPAGTAATATGGFAFGSLTIPAEHLSHGEPFHSIATLTAFGTALGGVLLAAAMYLWGVISPSVVATLFGPVYGFLAHRWYFDELYHAIFVLPVKGLAAVASGIDQGLIDPLINGLAWSARQVAGLDAWIDRTLVDGLVNATANATWSAGLELKKLQTGSLRQYVVFIAAGTVAVFVLTSILFKTSLPV